MSMTITIGVYQIFRNFGHTVFILSTWWEVANKTQFGKFINFRVLNLYTLYLQDSSQGGDFCQYT